MFLGGTPSPWSVFDPIAIAVSQEFETVEIALPGYGSSPPLPGRYTLSAAHEAVEDTLASAGIRACVLVGYSGGAYRALAIAVRGRVRVTGVYSVAGFAGLTPAHAEGMRGFAAALRAGQDLRPLAPTMFLSDSFASANPGAAAEVERWACAAPAEAMASELDAFGEAEDLTRAISGLRIPVVARVGSADKAIPLPYSKAIAEACPMGSLEIVEGAGHALPIEDLEGTTRSLRAFLGA